MAAVADARGPHDRCGSGWQLPDDALSSGTREEAEHLRAALRRAGIVTGNASDEGAGPARRSVLVLLFQQGSSLPALDVGAAVAPLTVERLSGLGLLEMEPGGLVRAKVHLAGYEGLVLASDFTARWAGSPPGNAVMAVSPSTRVLWASATGGTGAVLDLGTGCGALALLSCRRGAARVVATDVNRRAISVTRFNAWLNELDHLDVREGDLFEAVVGERFDTVLVNPPFVISPDTALTYRDGGAPGDELCAQVVRGVGAVLAPGGVASVLCNWVQRGPDDEIDGPSGWAIDAGCDALVLHDRSVDPVSYALQWLGTGGGPVDDRDLQRWLTAYARRGVTGVGVGMVHLRVPSTRRSPWCSHLHAPLTTDPEAGIQVAALLDLHGKLHDADDDALRAMVVRPAQGHLLDNSFSWHDGRYRREDHVVSIDGAFAFAAPVGPATIEMISGCDGRVSLGAAITAVTERAGSVDGEALLVAAARQLLSIGVLVPVD